MDPCCPYKHAAFASVWRRGCEAAHAQQDFAANPYPDKRRSDGRATFALAFRNAWSAGWTAAYQQRFA